MKKTSYSFLIPAIVGVLTLVICFITWRVEIYRVTFINALAMQYIATGSLLLSLALMVIFIWKGRLKGWPFSERLKVFIGTFIISMPLAIFVVFTAVYLLDGKVSSWSAPYKYKYVGRYNCEGAEVYEPELKEKIRICHPMGDYQLDNTLYVEKRSNALGIVVLWAITRS